MHAEEKTITKNPYYKGRRLEYRVMDKLSKMGYSVARTAGSHGLYDVIAWNKHEVRFVQVKCGNYIPDVLIEKLERNEVPPNCKREIWLWKDKEWNKLKVEVR